MITDTTTSLPPSKLFRWFPSPELVEQSNLKAFLRHLDIDSYQALLQLSSRDPDRLWNAVIAFNDIRFYRRYEQVRDLSRGIEWPRWCVGGTTNIVLNCIDKHVEEGRGGREAVRWVGELGEVRTWTYAELDQEVNRVAAGLLRLGCGKGDVVALYLPLLPETVAAFYAVAKIGAVLLPLFSGFGSDAVSTRVNAASARFIICADGARRRGKQIPMKAVIDAALPAMPTVERVVVIEALGISGPRSDRDLAWAEFLGTGKQEVPTAQLDADAPLMILYTSGTTGMPKGAVHTHCGLQVKTALDYLLFKDVKPSDRFMWMSDLGWLVVPAQICFTGLAGATVVLPEGVADYPAPDRLLRLAADHQVSVFGMSPTLARMLRASVRPGTPRPDLSALRIVVSGGETWDPPTWEWAMEYLCQNRLPILNHCGGTELGTLLVSSIMDPMNPGGFSGPAPGTGCDIVDDQGRSVGVGEVGELVMREPSIGTTRGLWRDERRYLEQYWSRFPGMWAQGDLVSRDALGIWRVHGRADDTLKIAGKRTGPAEVETAVISTGEVAEVAAIGVPDPIKGQALVCVVVARPDAPRAGLEARLREAVIKKMGSSFAPKTVYIVDELPKNRTGKLLRRLVRSALTGEPAGDMSSVANPEVLHALRERFLAAAGSD